MLYCFCGIVQNRKIKNLFYIKSPPSASSQAGDFVINEKTATLKRATDFFANSLFMVDLWWIFAQREPKQKRVIQKNIENTYYFGWSSWIRTSGMTESKSVALPLGYTPISVHQEPYEKCNDCFTATIKNQYAGFLRRLV